VLHGARRTPAPGRRAAPPQEPWLRYSNTPQGAVEVSSTRGRGRPLASRLQSARNATQTAKQMVPARVVPVRALAALSRRSLRCWCPRRQYERAGRCRRRFVIGLHGRFAAASGVHGSGRRAADCAVSGSVPPGSPRHWCASTR
jgi:hypothetical protein